MGSSSDSDSDAPEELTAEQGIMQDEEIRKVQRENKIRAAQEGKERRRQWAQRKTSAELGKDIPEVKETEQPEEEDDTTEMQEEYHVPGMLPSNIVDLLAAREKITFSSDSEEEVIDGKPIAKKKRLRLTGPGVLLGDNAPAQCLYNSIEFLKRRKMQVPRSRSSLKNARQALRLLTSRGDL